MLGIGISGLALTTEEHDWLQHPAVTSVILFARNFASRDQVAELSAAIRAAAARPILLCVGGRVGKVRHYVEHAGHTFEVDEFTGENAGLVVAELELDDAGAVFV